MGKLDGKVAIVTGASRGIGAAIAKALGSEGASVVVNYFQSEEKAKAVAAEIEELGGKAIAVRADVRSRDEVDAMVQKTVEAFGGVDILVNSALYNYSFDPVKRKDFQTIDWQDYQDQIDGTLKGAFNCCKAVLPHMMAKKSGKIINILTNLINNPVVAYHDYTTAKAAMVGFSRNLAAELGPHGITVNMIAPGLIVPTDASAATTQEVKDLVAGMTPLRRIGRPEDVGNAVLMFACDWSNFITGQYITVDGGLTMP